MLEALRNFKFSMEKETTSLKKDQVLTLDSLKKTQTDLQKESEFAEALDKRLALAQDDLYKLAKRHENDVLQLTTRKDFEMQNEEIASAIRKI